jgi:hypothetical protein
LRRYLQHCILILASLLAVSCESPGLATSKQTPVPPATPTATALPPTPTMTATATPVPSGPCENPLMSLNVGNQWKYHSSSQLGSSDMNLQVMEWNEQYGINAVIEMEEVGTGAISSDWVTCLEGGAIEDFPLVFVSMQLGDYKDGVLDTYYDSGIYAPSYSEFVMSNWLLDWEAEYLTEEAMCLTKVLGDISACISRSAPIHLSFETEGVYESVTVPAGTFPQALKVSFSFSIATTLTFPTLATSAPLTVRTTQWYAPFIGLIRSQVDSAYVELMPGQQSVAPIDSVVELVEFTTTP